MTMTSADVIDQLRRDGWYLARVKGSHHHFAHPLKPGIGTLRSIEKQAQVRIR